MNTVCALRATVYVNAPADLDPLKIYRDHQSPEFITLRGVLRAGHRHSGRHIGSINSDARGFRKLRADTVVRLFPYV